MTLLRSMIWIVSCTLASAAACAAESRAISVHVLDQVRGQPAATVGVTLEEQLKGADSWKIVAQSTTDEHGRVARLLPADKPLHKGVYRVTFATGEWFAAHHQATFFPSVTVTFSVDDPSQPYHIPLLLSPFGYSTYRGN